MKLDVPKRVFDRSEGISAIQFQTPTGGRKRMGQKGTRQFCELPFTLPSYTVAEAAALPEKTVAGTVIFITDGDAVGGPTIAISNGTDWVATFTSDAPYPLPSYTVAEAQALPEELIAGTMIYVSNGNAGGPTLAISNGTNFMVASTDLAIAIA